MSIDQRRNDLMIAVALFNFSAHTERTNPEIADHGRYLAGDYLCGYDLSPEELVDELWDEV